MHELAICQALMEQVERIGREQRAQYVESIQLGIGPLSGVEPRLLEQAFYIARAGSIADQATLVIESTPVRVSCKQCGAQTEVLPSRLLCGQCGDWRTTLISGDEIYVTGPDEAVVVYCVHGHEVSQGVCQTLRDDGYQVRFLEGGIESWTESGGPVGSPTRQCASRPVSRWRASAPTAPSGWRASSAKSHPPTSSDELTRVRFRRHGTCRSSLAAGRPALPPR